MSAAYLSSSFAADLALVLLHFLWQGTLIAGAVWLALHLSDRTRPTTRYGVVLLGGVLCVLAPIITLVLLRAPLTAGTSTQPVVVSTRTIAVNADAILPESAEPAPLPAWQVGLLGVWCPGVLLMAGRLLIGWLSVQRLRRRSRPVTQDMLDMASRYATRLGLRRLPRIAVSSRITEAMVVGLVRPLILLPAAWLTELPPDVLAAVVAHELAHVRRLDPWVNALQRIVETLLFYHPGVWWLSRQLRIEREFCCDELAVRITGQPLVYARTLELVAHRRVDRRIPVLATGIGDRKMTLLKRVHNVLGGGREDRPRSLLTPLAAVFVVLLGVAVYRMAWFSPAPLLADDEPRREREVERSRRGDDGGEREYRRNERRTETRRERSERESQNEGDERESRSGDLSGLEGDVSPEVRELIRDLRAEIDELRARLRDRDNEVEIRDVDRDGRPDVRVIREGDTLRVERFEREGQRERREVVEERDLDRDGEPDARVIREGRHLFVEEIKREKARREPREAPARRLLDDAERADPGESDARRTGDEFERRPAGAPFGPRSLRAQREEQLREHREQQSERLPEEPERDVLAAEVRELREQVRDLAQIVGDLKSALHERDAREDDERMIRQLERQRLEFERQEDDYQRPDFERPREPGEEDRDAERDGEGAREETARDDGGTVRERIREQRKDEFERRRNREFREESEKDDVDEESASIETENRRRYTLQSTVDGNVRIYVGEVDRDSVLEARVIELTPDGDFKLEGVEGGSDDASGPFDEGESGIEADPFASDDAVDGSEGGARDSTDPFGNEDADGEAEDGTADVTDDATDPFADDE